jgi:hypothetical protein|tara:strand:- start:26 stop:331 length:306 start_codon:yes stop_codon:yes gene_type:complete
MAKLIVVKVCTEFCSLLLAKPLVILDIPQLKEVLEKCQTSNRSCCSSAKDSLRKIAEQDIFKLIKEFSNKEVKLFRKHLLEGSKSDGINIIFEKISKNIII